MVSTQIGLNFERYKFAAKFQTLINVQLRRFGTFSINYEHSKLA